MAKSTQATLAAVPSADIATQLAARLARQRRAAAREGTLDVEARRAAMAKLCRALVAHKDRLIAAVDADFGGRSRHETLIAEIFTSIKNLRHDRARVGGWVKPKRRFVGPLMLPARAEVRYQPLGVVGIISPWNYPIYLTLSPVSGALAAGNRIMIKPSELTPRTSEALAELFAETFPPELVDVATGGVDVAQAFSALPFDHLLFTGSTSVGRYVMRAAADNLTPVTLELGGKSPVIIGERTDVAQAAAAVASGKLLNAGQTCIAPDYALVPAGKVDAFVAGFAAAARKLYPTLGDNPDYTAIINERHHQRLRNLVVDAADRGATINEVNPAGESDAALGGKIAPTLLTGVDDSMTVMQDEIFGPLLPVLPYRDLAEALEIINERPRPLALYLFDDRREVVERVLDQTISGGVCINDVILQIAPDDLPFGGVGPSGMGHYHGFDGFETFSKKKPIFYQSRFSISGLIRPPYGKLVDTMLDLLVR